MERGKHPKSLANLKPPIQPGEVRNPRGINRKRPITDEYFACASEPVPEQLRQRFNRSFRLNLLKPGVTWAQAVAFRMCFEALMEGSTRAAREIREGSRAKRRNASKSLARSTSMSRSWFATRTETPNGIR
jgi:hypothetical protein